MGASPSTSALTLYPCTLGFAWTSVWVPVGKVQPQETVSLSVRALFILFSLLSLPLHSSTVLCCKILPHSFCYCSQPNHEMTYLGLCKFLRNIPWHILGACHLSYCVEGIYTFLTTPLPLGWRLTVSWRFTPRELSLIVWYISCQEIPLHRVHLWLDSKLTHCE